MAKWLDKYEQGGLVLKKKTKDNYGKKPNVNDVKVSAGPGFEGEGYTAQNWKSPAWGGQFAMGGALPGAVGFMYARTINPAPANGKYAKKTKASAQNGKVLNDRDPVRKKMYGAPEEDKIIDWFKQYYGSDFFKENLKRGNAGVLKIDPEKISESVIDSINHTNTVYAKTDKEATYSFPGRIIMGNPEIYGNQPKNETYAHEQGHTGQINILASQFKNLEYMGNHALGKKRYIYDLTNNLLKPIAQNYSGPAFKSEDEKRRKVLNDYVENEEIVAQRSHGSSQTEQRADIMALRYLAAKKGIWDASKSKPGSFTADMLNKLYKTKELNTPVTSERPFGGGKQTSIVPGDLKQGDLKNVAPPKSPGTLLPELRQKFKDSDILYLMNNLAKNEDGIPTDKAQNGKEMSFYKNGLDFKPKSISKNGSVIKDDRGQWAHPGEVTEIGSNDITMQGVDYPVLGVSDTGDTQMMYPDQDYKFDGEKVTEFPIMEKGGWLDAYAQKGKKLSKQQQVDSFLQLHKPFYDKLMAEDEQLKKPSIEEITGMAQNDYQKFKGDNTRIVRNAPDLRTGQQKKDDKDLMDARRKKWAATEKLAQSERRSNKQKLASLNEPGSWHIQDKMRLFPNSIGGIGEVFDDYLNPLTFVGSMADNLGESIAARDPKAAALSLGMAAGAGALGLDPLGSSLKAAPIGKQLRTIGSKFKGLGMPLREFEDQTVRRGISQAEIDRTMARIPDNDYRPARSAQRSISTSQLRQNLSQQPSPGVQRIMDELSGTRGKDIAAATPIEWNPNFKFSAQDAGEAAVPVERLINHPSGNQIYESFIPNRYGNLSTGNYTIRNSKFPNTHLDLSTTIDPTNPYVNVDSMSFFGERLGMDEAKNKAASAVADSQIKLLMSHFPEKAIISPDINTSLYSTPMLNAYTAKLASTPGRTTIEDYGQRALNHILKTGSGAPAELDQVLTQFPKLQKSVKLLNEKTGSNFFEPYMELKGKKIDPSYLTSDEFQGILADNVDALHEVVIRAPKYKVTKHWKNGGWLDKYK